jgi:hypothetical protein
MASDPKYLVHFVQYLRPNTYGLGEGKHGYASLSHKFLHGGIDVKLSAACYNTAGTKGGGRYNMLPNVITCSVNKTAINYPNASFIHSELRW